ncbi:MAG TPA: hypothetical protein VL688_11805 [Verrucomicrobiae bacterium]|nr:hypothetical protein [Verrucomicrobiae bacterium]
MKTLLLVLVVFLSVVPRLWAEKVSSIHPDGSLALDNGQTVQLAGLELPEETLRLLPILLGGKDIEVRPDTAPAEGPVPAYLFVNTSEIDMPFADKFKTREKKVMVNELLLFLGAAKVDRSKPCQELDGFLRLEDEAKKKAQGIWSYEENFSQAPVSPPPVS